MFVGAVLRFVGQSMVGTFLFVYCYQLGFSLEVLLAYIIWLSLVCIIINHFLISHLINRLGPQRSNGISNLFMVLFTLGVYTLDSSIWHLFGLAILQAFATRLYYISQHVFLLQADNDPATNSGRQVGRLFSAEPLGFALGPIIGGLISWLIDPRVSIGIGALVLVAGGLLMFISVGWRHRGRRHHVDATQMWAIYRHFRQSWRLTLVALSHAADQYAFVLWVLWLGLVLANDAYGVIGVTQFLGALVGFGVSQWAGRQVDRGRGQQLMRASGVLSLGLGLARWWATLLAGLGFKLLIGFYSIVNWATYELRAGNLYEQTHQQIGRWQRYRVEYSICFENLENLGRGLFGLLALAISLLTTSDTTALVIIFTLSTGLSLGYLLRFTPTAR